MAGSIEMIPSQTFIKLTIWARTPFLRIFGAYGLSTHLMKRAENSFASRVIWYETRGKNPFEYPYLGRIIRGASHDAYDPIKGKRVRGSKAHKVRQRMRKYLYNRIGKNYRIR